jgi:hypothetical protein
MKAYIKILPQTLFDSSLSSSIAKKINKECREKMKLDCGGGENVDNDDC